MVKIRKSTIHYNVLDNVALCIVYFPPEGSTCLVGKDDLFNVLADDITIFKKDFANLISGDFNARTRSECDFIQVEEGSENP